MLRRWLFTISISLNLFFAALIGAQWLNRPPGPHGPPGRPDPMRMAEDLARTLPANDGEILRAAFAAHAASATGAAAEDADPMTQVRRVLATEPFDRTALQAALEAVQANRQALEAAISDALLDAATRMSPEGRRRLGQWPPPHQHPPRPRDDADHCP